MSSKTILFATLVLPLLMAACNRDEQSPTAAAPGQSEERQAQAPTSPDKMMENAPPAAGTPPPAGDAPAAGAAAPPMPPADASKSDAQQPNEPAKSY